MFKVHFCVFFVFTALSVTAQNTTWEPIPNPGSGYATSMITAANGDVLTWTLGGGLYRFEPNVKQWIFVTTKLPNTRLRFQMGPDSTLYLSFAQADSIEGGIYRSKDHGASWEDIRTPEPVSQLSITSQNHMYITGFHAIYLSTDSGSNWRFLGEKDRFSVAPHALAVDDNGVLYMSFRELESKSGVIYVSRDSAKTWLKVFNAGMYTYIHQIAVDRDHFAYGFHTGGNIARSNDSGSRWAAIPVKGWMHFPIGSPVIRIVTQTEGVSISSDHGETWISSGPIPLKPRYLMDAFTIDSSGRYFVVGEDIVLVSDRVTSIESIHPAEHEVSAVVYPNPVINGDIHVSIFTDRPRRVTVDLTDMLGRNVFSTKLSIEGSKNIAINAGHFPAGMLFLRILTETASVQHRLIVTR